MSKHNINEKNNESDKVEIVYNINNNNSNNLDLSTGNDNSMDETFKYSQTQKKNKKFIYCILISFILLLLFLGLKSKFKNKKDNNKNIENDNILSKEIKNPNQITIEIDNNKISDYSISYDVSSMYYQLVKTEEILTNFESINNHNNKRKLNELKKIKISNNKFLFIIDSKEKDFNLAYIILLNRNETIDNKNQKNNFDDSSLINNKNNNIFNAVCKITFNNNGTILNKLFNKNLNDISYLNEINEAISYLIPIVSDINSKENNRKLNEEYVYNNGQKNNVNWYSKKLNGKINIDNDALINSNYNSFFNITIEKNLIKSVNINKKTKIINSDYNNYNNDNNNIGNKFNILFTFSNLINSITTTSNETFSFKKKEEDSSILNQIQKKLKNIQFISYSNNENNNLNTTTNKLRILSKKNLNELNENYQSIELPLKFNYEIFKTNLLGINLALEANIEWVPMKGLITFQLFFKRGSKTFELEPKTIEIEHYKNFIKSYRAFSIVIINYLNENVIKYINEHSENIIKNINNYSDSFYNNSKKILEPLTNLFENNLKNDLIEINNKIKDYCEKNFNEIIENLNTNFFNVLNEILEDINKENNNDFNNINNEINSTLSESINKYVDDIKNLIDETNKYINASTSHVNNLKSYQKVSVNFYYQTKDIFNKINSAFNLFDKNLINSNFKIKSFIFSEILNQDELNNLFNKIDNIIDIISENKIKLNDNFIDNEKNFRKIYKNIIKSFLNKTNQFYNEYESNENIKNIENTINKLKESFNEDYKKLIDLIESKINYYNNYKIYFSDIEKISLLENETFHIKLISFKNNIIDALNNFTLNNFNEYENDLNLIDEEIEKLIENLNEENNNIQNNLNNVILLFEKISSENFINDYLNNFKNVFDNNNNNENDNFLNKIINNYYSFVDENVISKYNKTIEDIINNSLDKYLELPEDLIKKIEYFSSQIDKNTENLSNKIKFELKEKINEKLLQIILKNKNKISNLTNFLMKKNHLFHLNNFYNKCEQYKNNLNSMASNLNSKIDSILLNLNINDLIKQKEEELNSSIKSLTNNLMKKFKNLFCLNEKNEYDSECSKAEIKKMDINEIEHYKKFKLRENLNQILFTKYYINNLFNINDNLNEFSNEKFFALFKENFNKNLFNIEIKKFINNFNSEEMNNIKKEIESIKKIIKDNFINNYNINNNENKDNDIFNNIFNDLFNNENIIKNLKENLDILFINSMKFGREGKEKEINYYKNNKFYFNKNNKEKIENEFNKLIENYNNKLNENENNIKKNLTINEDFINNVLIEKIIEKINIDLNNYKNDLLFKFSKYSGKNCILIENNFTIDNIINNAINDIINDYSTQIKTNIENKKENIINNYIKIISKYFDDFNDNFKNNYKLYFDSYLNILINNSEKDNNNNNNNEISSITNSIKKGFENGLKLTLNELNKIINSNTLTNCINNENLINKIVSEKFYKNSFNNNNNIDINENINSLKSFCDIELNNEKILIKKNIKQIYENTFNSSLKNFFNEIGKIYLNNHFIKDENNIISKIDFIDFILNENNENLKEIISNFFDISSYETDNVSSVFLELINYIKNILSKNSIEKYIKKQINNFKKNSSHLIVDYFYEILSNNNNEEIFSEQIKNLISKNNLFSLKLILENKYYILINENFLNEFIINYSNNLTEKINNLIKKIENFKTERAIQIGKLGQGMTESSDSSLIVEYNKLKNIINKMILNNNENLFYLNLTDSIKTNIKNILFNDKLINNIKEIVNLFDKKIIDMQNFINDNVNLNVNLNNFIDDFNNKIKEIKIDNKNIKNEMEKEKENFINNLSNIFNNIENNIMNNEQKSNFEDLNKNETLKKLDSIESIIEKINNKIFNLSNSENELNNKINLIEFDINNQLVNIDNKINNYLKNLFLFSDSNEKINELFKNISNIYKKIGESFEKFLENNSEIFNGVFNVINNYKLSFEEKVRKNMNEKIKNLFQNNLNILNNNLKSKSDKGNLTLTINISEFQNALNIYSSDYNFNYTTSIKNTQMNWGYELNFNPSEYKSLLNIYSGGFSELILLFNTEFVNSTIEGILGKGIIGMNVTNNYLNDDVNVNYFTKYDNNKFKKNLFEIETFDSWNSCKNKNDCFLFSNNNFCPFYLNEDGKNEKENKNNFYFFNGKFNNNLCHYNKFILEFQEENEKFETNLNIEL